ncbi:dihydrofolate reductase family protein [Fulvivirgaceae bacterium PWU4]|uniref:Dihydrofolate reductase family protein n=1 Tax=Chryseosolibacter histidini TaxID=2782349 RepID=A0AAP2DL22_9BACT|nr:dihydrofolate reductase [Chryseosolibacter histidini]MBT1697127.1 dihydrofolate reductase family protein [Chryseosolibacter histidini]
MLTKLYASVSLNGQLLVQEKRLTSPPAALMMDFMQHVHRAGNMIMGRKTALSLIGNAQVLESFSGVHIVVLSNQLPGDHFCAVVRTPEAALRHLKARGFKTAFIAGGADTYNSFLTHDLVDELIVNISPEITTNGIPWVSRPDFSLQFGLEEMKMINASISQLRFRKQRVFIL